ncbi:hypothetical protein Dgeo_0384 [Deinococcus geothermalis DSM 11300]|uniref:Uncharacterized protein n=1 Tax=Deinococcus geothermalis (strain DSM 11300 / CIP 105573 / AG-3a) TaxID=319795 RepID=Q1J1E7_DEIGD|nr:MULTISPECIES: hypothetical protein [Deinococcus]ABF44687.1 hypothetical protein Dgeo_0384 [Deinococcus geothermalis DSM 11300]MBI0446737.1 hypothetical protein [Deinococcus sp. DB0503]
MLDNILNQMRRSAERVQRRGEELTQSTRLRLEVFGLSRELEGLYARLGRAYHAGADSEVLQGIQDEIRRVDEEISARERLIQELSHDAGHQPVSPNPTTQSSDDLTVPEKAIGEQGNGLDWASPGKASSHRNREPLDSERQRERER